MAKTTRTRGKAKDQEEVVVVPEPIPEPQVSQAKEPDRVQEVIQVQVIRDKIAELETANTRLQAQFITNQHVIMKLKEILQANNSNA